MNKIPLSRLIRATGTRKRVFSVLPPEFRKMDQLRLQRVYSRVIRHWQEAKPRLLASYERELAKLGPLVRDDISDLQSDIDDEGNWFTRLFIELRADIAGWAYAFSDYQRKTWRGRVLTATNVDLDTYLYAGDVEETVQQRVLANLDLIRDVDAQQKMRMSQAIYEGVNQRLSARDIAKKLDEITGFGRKRTLLIASVENQKLQTALARERAYAAGLGPTYVYRHSAKAHPRPWHLARNGKIFNDAAKPGDDMYIEPDDRPGIPIRCGCRAEYQLDLSDIEFEDE